MRSLEERWNTLVRDFESEGSFMTIEQLGYMFSEADVWLDTVVENFVRGDEHILVIPSDGMPTIFVKRLRHDHLAFDWIHWVTRRRRWITAEEWENLVFDQRA
jgi:hypothetical protein